MSPAETGLYYLQSRYYDPALCRFINADGLASTGQGVLGCNMFAYCGNSVVSRKDILGQYPAICINDSVNEENIRKFYGLDDDDDLPPLEEGSMLFLENTYSFSIPGTNFAVVRGHSVVMDYDKYCEYYFWGLSYGQSGVPYDYSETKGYVYGVNRVEDYRGVFFGGTFNYLESSTGGAVATNGVKASIISGQAVSASTSVSISYYFALSKDWVYDKACITWHPAWYGKMTTVKDGQLLV